MKKSQPTPVYTYFDPVPGISIEETTRLILLWKENWEHFGYEPRVLNESFARRHPLYKEFSERIARFPTVNKKEYDRACFLRWLAMSTVKGGLMADYDVFTYKADLGLAKIPPPLCIVYQGHVPSLVYARQQGYDRMIEAFMKYEVSIKDVEETIGQPHVSDMYILYRDPQFTPYEKLHIVKNHGEDGWKEAPLVHYANGAMNRHQPRHAHIKGLRNWE